MEGEIRRNQEKIQVVVGQSLLCKCFKCGKTAGLADSPVPATVMQKWICVSCGTLNQFEIEFRKEAN